MNRNKDPRGEKNVFYFISLLHECCLNFLSSEERYSEVLEEESILYSSGTLLSVLDCIMTILIAVCLLQWLF
jgi:hypothetical protein